MIWAKFLLRKNWLGDFTGDFLWSLCDFFTKTSGHPDFGSKVNFHPKSFALKTGLERDFFYRLKIRAKKLPLEAAVKHQHYEV
jgi:hypothetical protein